MTANPIPVYKELPFTQTPVEVYERVRSRYSFLLESIKGPKKTGRYSFIGFEPFMVFKSKGEEIEIQRGEVTERINGSPLKVLKKLLYAYRIPRPPQSVPFFGGVAGFLSYDLVHLFEKLPRKAEDDLQIPDIFLVFVDKVIAFDHYDNKAFIIVNPWIQEKGLSPTETYRQGMEDIREIEEKIKLENRQSEVVSQRNRKIIPVPNMTKERYIEIVKRCKEYIAAGDIFQANLSQRFSAEIGEIDPLNLYKILRNVNPSPFSAYLDFGDIQVVSSSPERLIRLEGNQAETRPIAGTRPRGKNLAEDSVMSIELITNEKERAEHIMLIDLERNDLGRVCEYGSIVVDELMILEEYSHVIHIVSNIKGRLRESKDSLDLLRAIFPGGTITGVPKVRCMEIIDELEPLARGPYTGSVGYISFAGDMDLNIIIRTFIIKDRTAYVQVGAGIVADSDPEREYYETLHKAQALFRTLEEM